MPEEKKSLVQLEYGLDDYPGKLRSSLLGIQHVLVMFTAMIGMPLIIASALNLPMEQSVQMVTGVMLGCGIGTLISAMGVGFVGARLPIVMGVFYIFIGPIVAISNTAGLAAAMTAIFIGGLIEGALSPIISKLRKFFPPLVTGTVITIIGVSLLPLAINNAVGDGTPYFGEARALFLAAFTIAAIILVNRFTKGFVKAISLFIALILGYIVGAMLGFVDFSEFANADWFGIPSLFPYGGFAWPGWSGLIAVVICFLVSAMETLADTLAVSKAVEVEATPERLRGAIAIDGFGSTISALFGGTPLTSYSQNIGVISLTGVGSRIVVAFGGVFLILMAFVPKLGALISLMPGPVLGGTLVVMFGTVASIGIDILHGELKSRRDVLVFATSLGLAVGVTVAPAGSFDVLSPNVQLVVTDGIVVGALVALVLNQILPANNEPVTSQQQDVVAE